MGTSDAELPTNTKETHPVCSYFLRSHYLVEWQCRLGIKRSGSWMASCIVDNLRSLGRGVGLGLRRKLMNDRLGSKLINLRYVHLFRFHRALSSFSSYQCFAFHLISINKRARRQSCLLCAWRQLFWHFLTSWPLASLATDASVSSRRNALACIWSFLQHYRAHWLLA